MVQPNVNEGVSLAGGGFGPPGGYGGPPPGGGFGGPPPGGGFGGPPGGGFGGPPPGGFGGPLMGGGNEALKGTIDTWMVVSIATIFCACGILGIIPVILANNAKSAFAAGDYAKAEKDIGTAKLLCILGFVLVIGGTVLGFVVAVVAGLVAG